MINQELLILRLNKTNYIIYLLFLDFFLSKSQVRCYQLQLTGNWLSDRAKKWSKSWKKSESSYQIPLITLTYGGRTGAVLKCSIEIFDLI